MEEIIKERLLTNAEAKEILRGRSKEVELGYEQKNALDYLKKYDKLTKKRATKLAKDLEEVKKLRKRQIIAIVNLLPKDRDDLRVILGKDYNLLTDEEKKLILDKVKRFI